MVDPDSAVEALRALIRVLDANEDRARYVRDRAMQIESLREQGYTWHEVLSTEERPLIIDILGQSMALLNEVGGRVRREEARCLIAEGLKEQEIADLLGVSVDHVHAMIDGST
jgi:DNA-directed RNA polymerase specialized sigma24 family protein